MGLYEDEEHGSKNDKRRGLALKSKLIKDSKIEEESDSDDEEITVYARIFNASWRRTNHGKRTRINSVKMSQRRNSRKILRRKAQSFATITTSHVKQECTLPKKYSKYSKKRGMTMKET